MTQQIALTKRKGALSANHDTLQAVAAMTSEQEEIDEALLHTYTAYINLTGTQRVVLIGLLRNIVSDSKQTDTDLAIELGISRWTIINCRQHRVFSEVLSAISIDVIRGKADKVIKNLFVLGEKSVSANELLLKVSGLYVPKMQSAVLHAKVDASSITHKPEDAVSGLVVKLGGLGLTKERVVELISEVYDKLKAEGAF